MRLPIRSVVAHPTPDGYTGRYVHFDGLPVLRIPDLMHLVRTTHQGDVGAVTDHLIDSHPGGWLTIPSAKGDQGECLCHQSDMPAETITHRSADPALHPWIYILNPTHLTLLGTDGDHYIHKADYAWALEPADAGAGPLRTWRVVYRDRDASPLLLLAAVPEEEEQPELEADMWASGFFDVTVESPTLTGALLTARALLATGGQGGDS
ncbi:hypothetical protein GCM10009760_52480 [Kitasatospora kazusensis]|uniref:Uncharacterized protein n=1 Tax=Kitasatospora kazusensis TaxID=407974 RepID=A0ABP5LZD4_9ACTN